MKKFWAVLAIAAGLGVVSGWAQTTNITPGLDIAISGKLIPSGTAVTSVDLAGNTNPISFLDLEIITGTTTNLERWIGQIQGSTTNLFWKQIGHVDFTPSAAPSYKFALAFFGDGQVGTSSNSTILISGTEVEKAVKGATNITVKAKLGGIWATGNDVSGGEEIIGSLSSLKPK